LVTLSRRPLRDASTTGEAFVADTVPGDLSTTATISVGGNVSGTLETFGDHDWYAITLSAGQSISIALGGTSSAFPGEDLDTYLRFRDSAGNVIAFNDDAGGLNSLLQLTAPTAGTYYIDVGAFSESDRGNFQLTVSNYVPPPVFTYDQIADQLVNGYWGGPSQAHNWPVTQGGSLTVNLTGLTAAGQTLARAALDLWSDIIGVTFNEVNSGGNITFDDNQSGAFCNSNWTGHTTTTAHVNVGTDWLDTYGTGLNTYSFQSYIHEIGHALGLGHAGNYNSSAEYAFDASYRNDCWSTTIMSYFDQSDNTFYQIKGFTEQFVLTPMNADIVAMSMMYGLSTTTRTENTVYGFGSTANRSVFDATQFPNAAYTVFDNGGTDTLNYSGYSQNQLIDLNQEAFSNVGTGIGNVVIARGTVIENATGGSGADTINGNISANVLNGGGGDDTLNGNAGADTLNGAGGNDSLSGGNGDDTLIGAGGNDSLNGGNGIDTASYSSSAAGVTVSLAVASAQNTVGAGTDTLSFMENLTGSGFADTLTGDVNANKLLGNAGNDSLVGGDGNDTLDGGAGDDNLNGGAGIDTADYTSAAAGVTVAVKTGAQNTIGAGTDTFTAIENLTGSKFADTLTGNGSNNVLTGNNGNDTLIGQSGADSLSGGSGKDTLDGGSGSDILNGGGGADTATYATATGAVTVNLSLAAAQVTGGAGTDTLTLIENLIGSNFADHLTGSTAANTVDGGGGNDQIDGGLGKDILIGGAGQDNFIFSTTPNSSSNWDTISDFSVADDTIQLSQAIFAAAGGVGTLSASAFRNGTAAGDADDRIIYDQATGKIYYDADGTGAGGKVQFAKVTAGTVLTNLDFQIFAPAQAGLTDKPATLQHDTIAVIQLPDFDELAGSDAAQPDGLSALSAGSAMLSAATLPQHDMVMTIQLPAEAETDSSPVFESAALSLGGATLLPAIDVRLDVANMLMPDIDKPVLAMDGLPVPVDLFG
jgi:serralysin